MTTTGHHDQEIAHENTITTAAYRELDRLRDEAAHAAAKTKLDKPGGNHAARAERDAFDQLHTNRHARYKAVENRLIFGRLDRKPDPNTTNPTPQTSYIGRIGITDQHGKQHVMDWRAPLAAPFYRATAAHPEGIARRRHLTIKNRTVTHLEDDILDLEATNQLGLTNHHGEGALMSALTTKRTGRMNDIVATIQAEQDQIVRDDINGTLIVQGGPGTGKTAVALHRAAYLLYAHRTRLDNSCVLVLGPSSVFLRYISQVLPALGESSVVLATLGSIYPGIYADTHDSDHAATLKGDPRMADLLAKAVANYQRVPKKPLTFRLYGKTLTLTPKTIRHAANRAKNRGPHNVARETFLKNLLNNLADQVLKGGGANISKNEKQEVIADLAAEHDIKTALNRLWLPLTPTKTLRALLALPDRLHAANTWLTPIQQAHLWRDYDEPFTIDDIPLLDELAELIGDPIPTNAPTKNNDNYANQVIDMLKDAGVDTPVTGDMLANRVRDTGPNTTLAEQAAADRTWAYGHVVIDEAQELTPMQWRTVLRRIPTKSITAVGDLAQTSSTLGARNWRTMLKPFVGDRLRVSELTVNYRTPTQIADLAQSIARELDVPLTPTSSVREGDFAPQISCVGDLVVGAVDAAVAQHDALGDGTCAVIVPVDLVQPVASLLRERLSGATVGVGKDGVDNTVAVMTAPETKGLEFDGVVVVEPAALVSASAGGPNDLYVAMTRPTQRLHVVHHQPIPGYQDA